MPNLINSKISPKVQKHTTANQPHRKAVRINPQSTYKYKYKSKHPTNPNQPKQPNPQPIKPNTTNLIPIILLIQSRTGATIQSPQNSNLTKSLS